MKRDFHVPYISRRSFLQRFGYTALGTTVLARTINELKILNSAVAQGAPPSDYKALICVFLNGGNDSNNMIIPTIPSEWENYANIRGPVLALPNADGSPAAALELKKPNPIVGQPDIPYMDNDGHTYGFHPAMPEMQTLFRAGIVAPVLNVGTLSFPLTKIQYSSNSVPRPPQLFSHSDQQTQWQTSLPDQPYTSGWGGRIADLFTAANYNLNGGVSMAVTLAGSNIFEVSNSNLAPPYAITTSGAVKIDFISGNKRTTLDSILNANKISPNLQTKAYGEIFDHSIDQAESLTAALAYNDSVAKAPWLKNFTTTIATPNSTALPFNSGLMSQMKMVARLIHLGSQPGGPNGQPGVNGGLGMKRQIFFIQVGGYDTHTNQTTNQGSTTTDNAKVIVGDHANRLADLSQTLNALYQALSDMGTPAGFTTPLKDCVTAFTASDFSRTFPANGYGSDHGWGGHQLVMGGAVKGRATYGKFPTLAVNGPDDTSTGRWIPTTAVDQYAATIATWFGVQPSDIATVFPNLGRFSTPNLGFL